MTGSEAEGWLAPTEFLAEFDCLDDKNVMSRAGKKLREGYLIAHFCLLTGAERFRILPKEKEEFDVQYLAGNRHPLVEVTELLDEGRKRNLEYEAGAPQLMSTPINKEDIPQRIREAVLKKTLKKAKLKDVATGPIELLLYFNMSVFRNVESDVRRGLEVLPPHCFDGVHVLIGTHSVMTRTAAGEINLLERTISPSEA